jgi:hypothetical protein
MDSQSPSFVMNVMDVYGAMEAGVSWAEALAEYDISEEVCNAIYSVF